MASNSIGSDFVYGMPWDEIDTVLALGPGMGAMTALLAERGKTLVALESLPKAGAALPYAPATFDLITLNGMFEPRFLAEAIRLLKPGGYLYAARGARFALEGLRYKKMLVRAGFGSVDVFGVLDRYDRQKAVYRLGDSSPRRFTRNLVSPPATWKGGLLRRVSGVLEDGVVVFGRKTRKDGRLAWPGLPHDGPVAQFSSSDKVFVLCFDGEPSSVFKGPKTTQAAALLTKEYEFLRAASRRHGAESESWPLRWPKPLGEQEHHGRPLYRYEFARGSLLSNQLLRLSFSLPRFSRLFAGLVDGYVELCARMSAAPSGSEGRSVDALLDRLAVAAIGDSAASERIKAACEKWRRKKSPPSFTHGDLSLSNTMLLPDGRMVLIDWENASTEGIVAIDLLRLLNDTLDESRLLKPKSGRAVMERARMIVREALGRIGVGPEDYEDVEALFVAHQFDMWLSRDAGAATSLRARNLLRSYRDREFALDVSPARGKPGSAG